MLRNRADTGTGNFDADYRQERLEWTIGDVGEGTAGPGGIPARLAKKPVIASVS
ncbi:MAG: hypothetical protein Q8M64_16520 [Methyloversatilis sp.]|nr:hypothetical protein [Methyloversatilis sp.]